MNQTAGNECISGAVVTAATRTLIIPELSDSLILRIAPHTHVSDLRVAAFALSGLQLRTKFRRFQERIQRLGTGF